MDPINEYWRWIGTFLSGAPGAITGLVVGVVVTTWLAPYALRYQQIETNKIQIKKNEQAIDQLSRQTSAVQQSVGEINRNLRIAICTRQGPISPIVRQKLKCQEFEP